VDWKRVEWKTVFTRVAESVREIGVLLFVFVPLEIVLKTGVGGHDLLIAFAFASIGIVFIVLGTVVESKL
jgi:hypothetical protein